MKDQPTGRNNWLRHHYQVESDYAQRILASPKHSGEREQLLREAYNEITRIIAGYNPGGGETHYTDVVVSIITKRLRKGGRVFDLGCATGNLLDQLVARGYAIAGIDVSDELVNKAKQRLGAMSDAVRRSDIMAYVDEDAFDCIVMDNVIEHFHPDTVDDVLRKCHRMLNENGYIVILTPHKFSGPHDISKHFLPLGSRARGLHLKEFSFSDLHQHLELAGFRRILGFPFHPRLLRKVNVIPDCSTWAARKAIVFERMVMSRVLSKTVATNVILARLVVAVLFPSVCVAQK